MDVTAPTHEIAAILPWVQPLPYVEAIAECGWPNRCGPRQWRGAVIAVMGQALPPEGLTPYSQRDPDGETINAPPAILYRVHGNRPGCYLIGEHAREMALRLVRHVSEVKAPDGESIPIREWRIRAYDGELRHLGHGWATYRLRTPYFPAESVRRRIPPKGDARLVEAWAGVALASSMEILAQRWGLGLNGQIPVSAHAWDVRTRDLLWERPARGVCRRTTGFSATFASNLLVPPGIAIGSKISEGLGELEMVGLHLADEHKESRRGR